MCRSLDAGDCKSNRALDRTASKKHQGTKSRLVVRRRSGVRAFERGVKLREFTGDGCDADVGAAAR